MKEYILNIHHTLSTCKKILVENFKVIISPNKIIDNFQENKVDSSPLPITRILSNYTFFEEYTPTPLASFPAEQKQVKEEIEIDDKQMDILKTNMEINLQLEAIDNALNSFSELAKNYTENEREQSNNHPLIEEAIEKGWVCLTVLQKSQGYSFHTIQLQCNLSILSQLLQPRDNIRKEFVNI